MAEAPSPPVARGTSPGASPADPPSPGRGDAPAAPAAMVWTLTAAIATVGANSLALGPIAPAVAAGLGADAVTVMRAAAGYGLGTAAGALALSPLVDRIGARRALVLALGALAATFAASAAAGSVAGLVGAQALADLAAGLALPATYAVASAISAPGHESRTLGRVLIGWTLSLVVGVSLSAVVADALGWRLVYGAFAALALGALAAVARSRDAGPADGSAVVGGPILWPHATLGVPGVAPLLLVCFGFMAAFYGAYAYVGAHVHEGLGRPVRASALVTLAYGAGFGLAALGDGLIDRIGARRALAPAFAAIALVYVGLALAAPAYPATVALAFAWGLANHAGLNLIVAGLSGIDPARRGAILGAYSATTYLAGAAGTLALAPVYEAAGFAAVAWTCAAAVAGTSIVGIALARRAR